MTTASHDQTRAESTPNLAEGQTAYLSRNEVASLCMKAARGAGMSWGMAEEAGFASAWLLQHGIDGPRHLKAHLDAAQGRPWRDLCPKVTPGQWQAPVGRALCPVVLGVTLCDYAGLPEGLVAGPSIRIGRVDHPVLLIPFLATLGAILDLVFDLAWPGGAALIDGGDDTLAQAVVALNGQQVPLILTARAGTPHQPTHGPAPQIAAETIAALGALAMRTTVPASDASRAGAGSTTPDND